MELYAYRARVDGREGNSVRSLRSALSLPLAGVHLDAYLTKDAQWVLAKDVPQHSARAHALHVHTHTRSQLGAACVPLESALALIASFGTKQSLVLELHDAGAERMLVQHLRRAGVFERTIVLAWDEAVLERLHICAPSLRLGLACSAMRSRAAPEIHKTLRGKHLQLAFCAAHTLDPALTALAPPMQGFVFPCVPICLLAVGFLSCTNELIVQSQERGCALVAYPVNNRLALSLLRRRGVRGILTSAASSLLARTTEN